MPTQTLEQIGQTVIELISDKHNVPKEQITLDSQFVADFGFDSLDKVEFVMTVEDQFDISVPDELAEKIQTVRNAVQAIQELISQ
jgi:acyl carrier protein